MISISCLESKLLNNNNWYGRFQLAPFQKGEGLTIANALRRTLLAEKSNFFITWVDFYNAEIPYSVLTGMRESVFDILLNLKQVIFTSDKILPNNSHFLKMPSSNNFNTQKVKFFSNNIVDFQHAKNQKGSASRFIPNETMEWDLKKKSNLQVNFLHKHNLDLGVAPPVSNNIVNSTKGSAWKLKNQDLIIKSYPITSFGVKRQTKYDQKMDHEISKSFKSSLFSVDRQKNMFKPWFNESSDMVLAMIKKNRIRGRSMGKTLKLQNFKNKKVDLKTKNVFCQNQILGKIINSENETPYLLPLRTFPKDIDFLGQFSNTLNSKKMSDTTYIAYICAKGPATIYAKNIKLPKGLKCVDPDKYIATLADDGLFYLRFAVTTEIKKGRAAALILNDISNLSISINHGLKFNTVKLKTFPKILFNKEIESDFRYSMDPFILKGSPNDQKKSKQQSLYNSQIRFFRSYSKTRKLEVKSDLELKDYSKRVAQRLKHILPFGKPINNINGRKIDSKLHIEIDPSKMSSVHYAQNLINQQRLLLTNDSIKQFNFQNTSVIANVQKTCLLNLQIKHYYYKCGRFDRFLFDLIKPFKPYIKSTYYNKTSLKNNKENVFDQDSNWTVLAYCQKIFERQKCNSQLLMGYNQNNLKNPTGKKRPIFKNLLKKKNPQKHINKLSNISSSQSNINYFSLKLTSENFKLAKRPPAEQPLNIFKRYFSKNKYSSSSFVKWQKIFKFIGRPRLETSSIYDYLQKLQISEATLICFLFKGCAAAKFGLKKEISLPNLKPISNIDPPSKPLAIRLISLLGSISSHRTSCLFFHQRDLVPLATFRNDRLSLVDFQHAENKQRVRKKNRFYSEGLKIGYFNKNEFFAGYFWPEKNTKKQTSQFLFKGSKQELNHLTMNNKPKFSNLWMSILNQSYLKKFLNECVSFQRSKNNILYILKSYATARPFSKYNNSSNFLNQNFIYKKNILSYLLFKTSSMNTEKSLTKIGFLRQWSFLLREHSQKIKLINQPYILSNKYGSLNCVRISTNLRAKPFVFIRPLSYKPIWIVPCQFQQNENKLWSFLYKINLSSFEQASFAAARPNIKTIFNPITTNSVALKPIYLNIEQIIYILKQSTKFHKNQRTNPVFFDSLNRISKDNDYPLNYSLIFPKLYNSLYKPFWLENFQPTMPPYFTQNKTLISKKNCSNRLALYDVWILGTNFIFKSNFFNTTLKTYLPWKYSYNFKITLLSLLINDKLKLKLNSFGFGSFFPKILSPFIYYDVLTKQYNIFNSLLAFFSGDFWQRKNSSFLKRKVFRFHLSFPKVASGTRSLWWKNRHDVRCDEMEPNKHAKPKDKCLSLQNNLNSYFPMFSMNYKSNIQNLNKEPYNINIYHSKIAFNLRYSYPFKYTIFETSLPFVNFSEKIWYLPNFDYMQYNESFKIYTTLAYTCLNTYQTHLPKYHNFYRRKESDSGQKKSQVFSFQPEKLVSQQTFRPSLVMDINKDVPFQSLFEEWLAILLQKNQGNWNFNAKYKKFYHEKPNAYPFLMIHNQLPSVFKSTYPWRIMNNQNFNDAFIIIPCIWSLNFQLDRSPNLKNLSLRDPFKTSLQKLSYMNYIFQNTNNILVLNSLDHEKQVIKNRLPWSKTLTGTNKNNELRWFSSFPENNLEAIAYDFPVNNKNFNQKSIENSKKSFFSMPKFKMKKSLKKLAIGFENIYYKNFLWNSQKITLRILNNAVLPLVANRKYSISDFIRIAQRPKKNYQRPRLKTNPFINIGMQSNTRYATPFYNLDPACRFPLGFMFSTKDKMTKTMEESSKFSASFVWGFKQKKNPYLNFLNTNIWNYKNFDNMVYQNKNKTPAGAEKITNDWFYQKLPFYSIRHKNLGATNFMCSKTYPSFRNDNPTKMFKSKVYSQENQALLSSHSLPKNEEYLSDLTYESQTQQSDKFFSESFSSVRSKWKPFFTESLRYSQEKDLSLKSPFTHFTTQKVKSNQNNKNELLSSYPVISSQVSMEDIFRPEKLVSLRKNRWMDQLIQRSTTSSPFQVSSVVSRSAKLWSGTQDKNDSKIKSPLINNLWSSSFFFKYSLHAISTKSDLFLQNLISNDNWTSHTNDINIFQTDLRMDQKNLKQPLKKKQYSYDQSNNDRFLNAKSKSYDKTIHKILQSQNNKSAKYFVLNYNDDRQKAINFAILGHFKISKVNIQKGRAAGKKIRSNWSKNQSNDSFFLQYPKKNIDYTSQTPSVIPFQSTEWGTTQKSINALKNKYFIRRLKIYEQYFGNPLRRRINLDTLNFFNIILSTKLYKEFTTVQFKKINQHIIKSWKSIIWTAQANTYFCFCYPLFIQQCNLPWQKSKHIFYIPKYWLNTITRSLQSSFKLADFSFSPHLKDFKSGINENRDAYLLNRLIDKRSAEKDLSKTNSINTVLNTNLFITYAQLSSSSHKTHESLLLSRLLTNLMSQVYIPILNKSSCRMIGYFTIKESLNSIYKVNYIVESQVFNSKPVSELGFDSNKNNIVDKSQNTMDGSQIMKKFENIQRDSITTDSLTISNFLNGTYSFVPSQTIILNSFNELIDSKINKSKIENENEYIQIDIWTNGELSPRQALLNAFRKLFELFYNLSKYNCLKPLEI